MYAIREIADVNNDTIKIKLPNDFPSNKAEIIIFPLDIKRKAQKKSKPVLPELITINKDNYASQIILEERR